MESQRDKATEIYNEMQVYDWCDKIGWSDTLDGYMPNDEETKKKCHYMLDEIILLYGDKDYGEVAWWKEVKAEIKHL